MGSKTTARGILCVAIALVALAAAMVGCCEHPFAPSKPHVVPPPPLYPASHESPEWSSLGMIVYEDNGVTWVDSTTYAVDWDLIGVHVMDPVSGQSQLVIPGGNTPGWSADGLQLVLSYRGLVHTALPDGSGLEVLGSGYSGHHPAWSADGSRIAWVAAGDIWIAHSSGEGAMRYLSFANDPDWHPSELLVACGARIGEFHGIVEVNPMYGGNTRLVYAVSTDEVVWVTGVDYSPDGEYLAFTRHDLEGRPQIWVVGRDGSHARQLTWDGGESPSWSPDGTQIVYARVNWHSAAPTEGVLWTVGVVTGEQTQLTYRREE